MIVPTFLLLALSPSAAPVEAVQAVEPEHGWVEFSRDASMRNLHSIKVFVVLEEKNRTRYLDEIGGRGSRTLTVRAPVGESEFVVIVEPVGVAAAAGPTNPVRRTRANVTVEVEPDATTPVTIGGFTDFQRGPSGGDPLGTKFVDPADDPEASQFRTTIVVGEPKHPAKRKR